MYGPLVPPGYLARIADQEISRVLDIMPAVVIEGPKACGKTWAAQRMARSQVLFDVDDAARMGAELTPRLVLEGEEPRLLDEWQTAPGIWNHVRRACDEGSRRGRFILTGSAVPPDDITRHSGAGRIGRVRLRPMTLAETGESTGEASLGALLAGGDCMAGQPEVTIPDLVDSVCRGGWPRLLGADVVIAREYLRHYLDEICRSDLSAVDGVRRDPGGVRRLLASLGRNVATTAALTTLAALSSAPGSGSLNRTTVAEYIRSLERLFVVEDLLQWRTHLRSKAMLRNGRKRHLVDPSLAAAAMGASPARLLSDLRSFGYLFESLVVRDLRVYAQANLANVWHYRDNTGLEIDAVVETRNGVWLAVEVKLGRRKGIDQAARSLLRLRDKVDKERIGEPVKLIVITATGYGYERPDGVSVVPITALGP